MNIEWLQALALAIWGYAGVKVIVCGVPLNLALALAVAARTGTSPSASWALSLPGNWLLT